MQENQIFHHYFINNSLSSLIRGIADYFGTEFFDRTKEIVISTYEKGVQHWLERQKNGGEKMTSHYPYIVMDPDMAFEPDPQAGRFFWGYPNFMGQFASQLFKPAIYEDSNLLVAPILNRYKGRFDLIVWCSSIYELMDFRMLTYQLFGGQERIIKPVNIDGVLVLPDELLVYTYDNPYTGESYSLDWANNKSEVILVKNINQNRMVYPFQVNPWIKMLDVNDGAEKYGGGDEVSDHRITITCEWECSLPTHIGIIATKQPNFSPKSTKIPILDFYGNDGKNMFGRAPTVWYVGEWPNVTEDVYLHPGFFCSRPNDENAASANFNTCVFKWKYNPEFIEQHVYWDYFVYGLQGNIDNQTVLTPVETIPPEGTFGLLEFVLYAV